MTDSINVNKDIKTLSRYALGYTPEEKEYSVDPSSLVWTIGLEKGFRGVNTLAPYAKNAKKVWTEQKQLEEALKGTTKKETVKNYKRAMEIQNSQRRLMEAEIKEIKKSNILDSQKKALIDCKKATYYNNLKREIEAAKKLDPKAYAQKIKDIEQKIADLNLKSATEKITKVPTSKMGKIGHGIKKYSGYYNANKKVAEVVAKSSKLQKVAKFGRMNAVTAVGIDLLLGIPEIVETQKELGTKKAIKQTGRVVAIAGTQVAAYAIGAKSGAALGAAIGSIIPGAGTLVGAILGTAIGLTASYFAGKGAQKILGKSELDQAQDKVAQEVATEASQDPNTLTEVMTIASERFQNDPLQPEQVAQAYNNVVEDLQSGKIEFETIPSTTVEETNLNTQVYKPAKVEETTNQIKDGNQDNSLIETINKLDYIINLFDNSENNLASYNNFDYNNTFNMAYNPFTFNMPFMQNFSNNLSMYYA